MNRTQKLILFTLSTDDYRSAKEIGEKALISERTVRNHIFELSEYLKNYGAEVESKHRSGYKLVIFDAEKFANLNSNTGNTDAQYIPENSDARCDYIIVRLIEKDDYIETDVILDSLYISDFTLQADLNKIRKILQWYDLRLVTRGRFLC